MQPRKIRVADIESLQRTLENVPESRVKEVTTVQAEVAKMPGRKKSGSEIKTRRGADSGAEGTAPATESKAGGEGSTASIDKQQEARGVTKAPPGVRTTPLAATTTSIAKGMARPDDGGARRSAFVPKEDTRDI